MQACSAVVNLLLLYDSVFAFILLLLDALAHSCVDIRGCHCISHYRYSIHVQMPIIDFLLDSLC